MTRFQIIFLLPLLLLASCAKDSNSSSTESGFKPLSQRLDENNGYAQDESGNWAPRSDKRSPYESQGGSRYFDKKSNYNQKAYQAGEYAKKSWWGNKDYGRKAYAGETDGSRFQQGSKFQGRTAREAGGSADIPDAYQTGAYATSAAREAGAGNLDRPSDAETDIRRRVYKQPEIIDWREQRSLTLDQSKGLLGR
jgi:Ni/Co efflux regulator RcnB